MNVLRKIDHIGVIVKNLEKAAEFYTGLGFERSPVHRLEQVGIEVIHVTMGDQKIELICYMNNSPSFGREVMGNKFGLNHVSFEVGNIEKAISWLESKGNRLKEGFPTQGSEGVVAFFEPNSNDQVLIEIHEPFYTNRSA